MLPCEEIRKFRNHKSHPRAKHFGSFRRIYSSDTRLIAHTAKAVLCDLKTNVVRRKNCE